MSTPASPTHKHPCPCCGYLTMQEPAPGTFEICPVCFWEDDNVQFDDPIFRGGANTVSLNEARAAFVQIGACEPSAKPFVRAPLPHEIPDNRR